VGQYDPESDWDVLRASDDRFTEPAPAAAEKVNSRHGKVHIGAYLDARFRKKLRLIQAETMTDIQSLLAEALTDLFQKHGVADAAERPKHPPSSEERHEC
jgi:hypothetical protein